MPIDAALGFMFFLLLFVVSYAPSFFSTPRLTIPKDTPEQISALMRECWHEQAWLRPSCAALVTQLEKIHASTTD